MHRIGAIVRGMHFYNAATMDHIKRAAAERARKLGLPYAGALLPAEAHALMQAGARLVDVRTQPELLYVGKVPGSVAVEWQTYPGNRPNPEFVGQLAAAVPKDQPVMFLCRSGARSHAAAAAAARDGWRECYNVLEGFEGDKDAAQHRNAVGGWRKAGLPWTQS
jgi:rhodanese-related sulfurtransferase